VTTKDDTDDFTEQALEYIMEPLKVRLFPYLYGVALFNIILFLMIAYLVWRLSQPVRETSSP
jgi:hypothetical protein